MSNSDISPPSIRDETDHMLRAIDSSVSELERKISEGRVRDCEKERVRIKRHRALANALKTREKILGRKEREELAARLDQLEQRRR